MFSFHRRRYLKQAEEESYQRNYNQLVVHSTGSILGNKDEGNHHVRHLLLCRRRRRRLLNYRSLQNNNHHQYRFVIGTSKRIRHGH